jgi:hypothetical protein
MDEKKQVSEVEVILDGEALGQFLDIRRDLGLTDDAEVLRFIINWFFEKKIKKKTLKKG